jgi:hypothetical protein
MFLCIAEAGLTLYFTAEAIVKAISWQKKFIRKMNEQQLSPPLSLSGYLLYMADWTQGPPSPFLSLFNHGLLTIYQNVLNYNPILHTAVFETFFREAINI